jgi:hypothetical protein
MTAQPDVDKLIQQTRQYEFSDGLRDVQLALLLGLSSVAVWLSLEPGWLAFVGAVVKTFGRWAVWINMLPMVVALGAVLGMLWVMDFVRRRWLWRESGMVKSSRWVVPRGVNVLSAVILVGGIAVGLGLRYLAWVDDAFVLRMLWAATGWSFGYTLFGVGRHLGLLRYVRLGVVGGLASTGMLILPLSFGQVALAFGLGWAVLLGASGAIALRRAIRSVQGRD